MSDLREICKARVYNTAKQVLCATAAATVILLLQDVRVAPVRSPHLVQLDDIGNTIGIGLLQTCNLVVIEKGHTLQPETWQPLRCEHLFGVYGAPPGKGKGFSMQCRIEMVANGAETQDHFCMFPSTSQELSTYWKPGIGVFAIGIWYEI